MSQPIQTRDKNNFCYQQIKTNFWYQQVRTIVKINTSFLTTFSFVTIPRFDLYFQLLINQKMI